MHHNNFGNFYTLEIYAIPIPIGFIPIPIPIISRMAIPIPMGFPWEWDSHGVSHPHAHLYYRRQSLHAPGGHWRYKHDDVRVLYFHCFDRNKYTERHRHHDRLRRLGLWLVEEQRNRSDLLEVFKLKAGISSVYFQTFLERNVDNRTRGHTWEISNNRSKLHISGNIFLQKKF